MKCTTMEAAIERYGSIVNGVWAEQDYWLKSLLIPEDWFPNWFILNTKHQVHSIYCNIDIHAPLFNALKGVRSNGASSSLHTFDGSFALRDIRGGHSISLHAYGLALDVNASEEPLGSTKRLPDGIVNAFTSQGFTYGGDFHGRKDPMHFQWGDY